MGTQVKMTRFHGSMLIFIIWQVCVRGDPDYMRNLNEEEQNERLHQLFDHIDANGNAHLDNSELSDHLKDVHNKYMDFDVDFWFDKYDKDQNGLIDGSEFDDQLQEIRDKHFDNYVHFRKKFKWCDADEDNYLTREEFHIFQFPREYPEYKHVWMAECYTHMDMNNDGKVEIQEFIHFWSDSNDYWEWTEEKREIGKAKLTELAAQWREWDEDEDGGVTYEEILPVL